MKNNANGISPAVALILTALVAVLTAWMFRGGHIFWGVVLTIICVDFFADLVLSFKKV